MVKPVRINPDNLLARMLDVAARLARARSRAFRAARDQALYERELTRLTPEGCHFFGGVANPNDIHQLGEVYVCQAREADRDFACGVRTKRASYEKPSLAAKLYCDKHLHLTLPDDAEDEGKDAEPANDTPF